MHRILVTDPLHQAGLALLEEADAEVHLMTEEERPRLGDLLGGYDAVVVRSATKLTGDLLRPGHRLRVVARAGIGVDSIDVATATELGILVVNSPTANLVSATEHTFASMLALARPEGRLLVLHNQDVPGVVGRIGSLLGDAGINIAEIHLARADSKNEAMAVLRLDETPEIGVLETISELPEMMNVDLVEL